MSFSLNPAGAIVSAAQALGLPAITPLITDWRSRLLPASFRGVPFFVMQHEELGGRRGVVHEFPLRDIPGVEDMGGAARRYMIDGYLTGDDYDENRDALRRALFDTAGAGTLVHPYLGTLTVQVLEGCSVREHRDQGRIATVRINCIQAGDVTQSRAAVDTGAGVLNAVKGVVSALKLAYTVGVIAAGHPGFVLAALTEGLEGAASSLLGLPNGVVGALGGTINGIFAAPADTTATPAAIDTAFGAVGAAMLASPPAEPAPGLDPGDPTGGLIGLAAWSGAVSPPAAATIDAAQQQANASLLTALVQGEAVAQSAAIYAQTDFTSAQAAEAARAAILPPIDAQLLAAAGNGDDGSFQAWLALGAAVAADLVARAQALPQLASYAFAASLPAIALAQRLYAEQATMDDGDALAALNAVLHPLFMPAAGSYLEPGDRVMSASSDASQIPTLTVGGMIYAGWTEIEVTRQIDHMCSEFRIKLAERWSGQTDPWQITPASPCAIKIGPDPVLTGYVDAYRPEYDRGSHNVEITGRSMTEDIVDCTPDIQGGQFNGYALDAIARAIAAPFGIGVVVQAPVGDPFPDATIQRHETGFQYLERLARLRSVLLADDPMGRLVLTTAGSGNATDALVEGQNIERGTAELNMAKRFSIYRVKTQNGVQTAPGVPLNPVTPVPGALPPTASVATRYAAAASAGAANSVPQTPVVTTVQGQAVDPGVPRYRPHVMIGESALTPAQATARAVWQAKYNAARGTEITIEVMGYRQSDGSFWLANTLATVTSPFLQIDAQLLIVGVSYVLQPGRGRLTRLRLGPVDGYQPDPGQVKVRKGKHGSSAGYNLNSIGAAPVSLLNWLYTAATSAIARGKVTGAQGGPRGLLGLQLLDDEAKARVEHLLPYGRSAMPLAGDAILLRVGAAADHLICVCVDNPALRILDLAAGEFGDFDGASCIVFRADRLQITSTRDIEVQSDGTIFVTAPNLVVNSTGTISVDGNVVNVSGTAINLGGAGGPAVARVGDTVSTPSGDGTIISGSAKVNAA